MKSRLIGIVLMVGQVVIPSTQLSVPATVMIQSRNTVQGRVAGTDNRPVQNVRVFLLNDGYSQVGMQYSDSAGRYRFGNVPAGNYYLQVEPAGTEFEAQTVRIEVNPVNTLGTGGEVFTYDLNLRPRKNPVSSGEALPAKNDSSVFYQDVPEAARKEYKKAAKSFEKKEVEPGVAALKKALEIFPEYYDAMELLGSTYVDAGDYPAALPLLVKAVEINDAGWHGFYSLGVACVELKHQKEGLLALRKAAELNPTSPNVNMRLGMVLAQSEATFPDAIDAFQKVIHVAGKQIPQAYLYLATIYSKRNQNREAADALDAYLQSIPADAAQKEQREKMKKVIEQLRQKAAVDDNGSK
ncbi:MAG TPA: carboxypeptidase regulatory-like domain-containing protein [Acidobacteriota bacterium]|nr:carboxypeptidase regulatory-like domain-containing protein [Acidobacteriota bacterium]